MSDERPGAETKALETFEVKDEAKGEIEAVIATLGVVDRDHDIIALDAIKDGSRVKLSSFGHDAMFGDAPVGKGVINIEGNKAIFRGKYFLSTTKGRESFATLKELGADTEWSWGFRVVGSETPDEEQQKAGARRVLTKTDAFEVSPVILGAGIGTHTLAVKEATPEPVVVEEPDTKALEAEAQRIEAEAKQLQVDVAAEVERFQKTRRWLGAA